MAEVTNSSVEAATESGLGWPAGDIKYVPDANAAAVAGIIESPTPIGIGWPTASDPAMSCEES